LACHYAVLDLKPDASFEEVKRAFKRRALAVHPDKGGSAEAFNAVCVALEVLQDPIRRSRYDSELAAAAVPRDPFTKKHGSSDNTRQSAKRQRLGTTCPEAALFLLLDGLPVASRRAVLAVLGTELTAAQRGSLEVWRLAHEEEINTWRRMVQPAQQDSNPEKQQEPEEATDGGGCHRKKNSSTAFSKGIIATGSAGTRRYRAEVHFENVTICGRTATSLDAAIADLVLLNSLKQFVQAAGSGESLAVRLRLGVQQLSEGRQESELGFSYLIRLKQSFWAGRRDLNTPTFKSVEDAAGAWEQLALHSVQSTGAGGHIWHFSFEELQEKWRAFKLAYGAVWEEAAGAAARDRALEKIERLEDANTNHREQLLQRWERQRKRLEDECTARINREKKAVEATEKKTLEQARRIIAKWSGHLPSTSVRLP
jgi:curved DNA-binding protein CbpA